MKALGILLLITTALVVGGWSVEAWLAERSEPEASPAELRAQMRLGKAAGLAAKVSPEVSAAAPPVPGEPVIYVCGLGTGYLQRTCEALIRIRFPLALSQARFRGQSCQSITIRVRPVEGGRSLDSEPTALLIGQAEVALADLSAQHPILLD